MKQFCCKDVTIPAGTSLEVLSGGKVVLQATDILKIDVLYQQR